MRLGKMVPGVFLTYLLNKRDALAPHDLSDSGKPSEGNLPGGGLGEGLAPAVVLPVRMRA